MQHGFRAGTQRRGVGVFEAPFRVGDDFERVAVGVGVRRERLQRGVGLRDFRPQRKNVLERAFRLGVERFSARFQPVLREVADGGVFRGGNGSRVAVLQSGENFQESRFPRSVGADEPDAFPRADRGGNTVEKHVRAEAETDAVEREHAGTRLRFCRR